jgi:hypothetical protein
MLDHVFTDAIGALRDALETARLERQAPEERFQSDVLLGNLTWETSYCLPGEGHPPRVQADLTLLWPTWAQSAYRSWFLDEDLHNRPAIEVEVAFRIQRLTEQPDPALVTKDLPLASPLIGDTSLEAIGPTLETGYHPDLSIDSHAVEITYHGTYELGEDSLADGGTLDQHFASIGGWIASILVRLGDVPLEFEPADSD